MLPSELIEKEENWLQNCLAKTAKGKTCSLDAPEATKFCAGAAIIRFADSDHCLGEALFRIASKMLVKKGYDYPSIARFNNTHTHPEVLAFMKEVEAQAIEDRVLKVEEPCALQI